MPEHYYEPMTNLPKERSQKVAAPKAFPASETQEPKGRTRFGPPPQPERKTTQNVFNTDRFGRAKPGQT